MFDGLQKRKAQLLAARSWTQNASSAVGRTLKPPPAKQANVNPTPLSFRTLYPMQYPTTPSTTWPLALISWGPEGPRLGSHCPAALCACHEAGRSWRNGGIRGIGGSGAGGGGGCLRVGQLESLRGAHVAPSTPLRCLAGHQSDTLLSPWALLPSSRDIPQFPNTLLREALESGWFKLKSTSLNCPQPYRS